MLERPFAHCYETGGMRRVHLRGRENILKRLLIHVGAYNLSLVLRLLMGQGTPRGLKDLVFAYLIVMLALIDGLSGASELADPFPVALRLDHWSRRLVNCDFKIRSSATGC